MSYLGTTVNTSPTIAGKLGEAITGDASFLCVKYNGSGAFVKAGAGEAAIGIILPGHAADLKIGDEVSVQIKDIALAKTGAAITCGAAVSCDANGKLIPSVATKYIIGYALKAAGAADAVIPVQITKSGTYPA